MSILGVLLFPLIELAEVVIEPSAPDPRLLGFDPVVEPAEGDKILWGGGSTLAQPRGIYMVKLNVKPVRNPKLGPAPTEHSDPWPHAAIVSFQDGLGNAKCHWVLVFYCSFDVAALHFLRPLRYLISADIGLNVLFGAK